MAEKPKVALPTGPAPAPTPDAESVPESPAIALNTDDIGLDPDHINYLRKRYGIPETPRILERHLLNQVPPFIMPDWMLRQAAQKANSSSHRQVIINECMMRLHEQMTNAVNRLEELIRRVSPLPASIGRVELQTRLLKEITQKEFDRRAAAAVPRSTSNPPK